MDAFVSVLATDTLTGRHAQARLADLSRVVPYRQEHAAKKKAPGALDLRGFEAAAPQQGNQPEYVVEKGGLEPPTSRL